MYVELFHESLYLVSLGVLWRDHTQRFDVDRKGGQHAGLGEGNETHNRKGHHGMEKVLEHHDMKELEYQKEVHEISWRVHNLKLV